MPDLLTTKAAIKKLLGLTGGEVVSTSDTQTLTNKTISGASNTITNITTTAREDLVAQWDTVATKTNIGTAYVDVYDNTAFPNADAKSVYIDFTDKTQYRVIAQWNKIGAGTQQLKACDAAAPTTNILHNFSNIVSGENDSGLTSLPGFATGRIEIKLMALSSTSTDDPVLQGVRIWLK
jgi:hypothetical protein